MSSETVSSQEEPEQEAELSPEVLDRIKHPPAIDDVMMELNPQEVVSNPAIAPQMIQEPGDLRDDMKRD